MAQCTVVFLELVVLSLDALAENGPPGSDLELYTSPYTNYTPKLDSILHSIYSLAGNLRHGLLLVCFLRVFLFVS